MLRDNLVFCKDRTSAYCGPSMPVKVQVFRDSTLSGYQLAASVTPSPLLPGGSEKWIFGIRLQRTLATRLYVVIVALIPLVLGGLLFLAFAQVHRTGRPVGPPSGLLSR
jgi:hypothetical protein